MPATSVPTPLAVLVEQNAVPVPSTDPDQLWMQILCMGDDLDYAKRDRIGATPETVERLNTEIAWGEHCLTVLLMAHTAVTG